MECETTENRRKPNLLLMGAAVLFVALAVVFCLLLQSRTSGAGAFRIRFGDGQTITVRADETRVIVIRDGKPAEELTGEGEENVIRIENGTAWMEHATCKNRECVKQGSLNADTVGTRPLGPWIICAPHGVSIEYIGDGS